MSEARVVVRSAGIERAFLAQRVLCGVSFELRCGDVSLLLGANGCGKSTLLRIVGGLLRPDRGSVQIFLNEPGPRAAARKIGYQGHQLQLYGALSVEENLNLFASLGGAGGREAVERALVEWELYRIRRKTANKLSKGLQTRLALARVFLCEPELLLLDEPSSALDDATVEVLLRAVAHRQAAAPGMCAIIATHDVARLRPIATRTMFIEDGTVKADSALAGGEAALQIEEVIAMYRRENR